MDLQATKRFESEEISHDEFLAVAHQIHQLFQYQEEKLQRSDSWDAPNNDDPVAGPPQNRFPSEKKQPLPSTPGSPPRGRARDPVDDAELTHYDERESKRPMSEGSPGTPVHKYSRSPPERPGRFTPNSCSSTLLRRTHKGPHN